MAGSSFRVAMVQMRVDGGAREANLARAGRRIEEAVGAGARVVVLPEAMDLGWTHSSAKTQAEGIVDGTTARYLREWARRYRVHICAGLIEKAEGRVYNAAVLMGPGGDVLVHHRKLNELDIAHDLYGPGDRLGVVETELGRMGVMICADAFAPGQVVSRTLGLMKAQIILSPCAWAVTADHDQAQEPYGQLWLDNYGPVAREHRMWIIGVSNVGWIDDGPWKGRKCIGCSIAMSPEGRPAVRGPYGVDAECVLYVDVSLNR